MVPAGHALSVMQPRHSLLTLHRRVLVPYAARGKPAPGGPPRWQQGTSAVAQMASRRHRSPSGGSWLLLAYYGCAASSACLWRKHDARPPCVEMLMLLMTVSAMVMLLVPLEA